MIAFHALCHDVARYCHGASKHYKYRSKLSIAHSEECGEHQSESGGEHDLEEGGKCGKSDTSLEAVEADGCAQTHKRKGSAEIRHIFNAGIGDIGELKAGKHEGHTEKDADYQRILDHADKRAFYGCADRRLLLLGGEHREQYYCYDIECGDGDGNYRCGYRFSRGGKHSFD